MACYNAEDFLEYSLLSIGQQRYQNIQVIFVDDGSKDDSVAIARKFLSSPQHKIIELGENKGIGAALNSGLAAADGEIMARFDADDYMYEYRIRDQVDALLEDKNLDLIGSGADLIGISTGKLLPPIDYCTIKNTLLVNNPFIHPTIMFKRRLFDQS